MAVEITGPMNDADLRAGHRCSDMAPFRKCTEGSRDISDDASGSATPSPAGSAHTAPASSPNREATPMQETYDLIGGLGAAKEILTQPAGAIGLISYDGDVRTVFLRCGTVDKPDAYLADLSSYATVEEMVEDSYVTLDREHGEVLAWQITADGYTPLWHYDASRIAVGVGDGADSDEQTAVERGNNQAICAAINALPPSAGFLIGGFSPDSDFILGFRKGGVVLSSSCGPSLYAERLSPAEDLSDIPSDPRAQAHIAHILDSP